MLRRAHTLQVLGLLALVALFTRWTTSCAVPTSDEAAHFPLIGEHVGVTCERCHTNGSLVGAPEVCSGCHEGPPDHYEGQCDECHSEAGWEYAVIDHDRYLSLDGGHDGILCTDCHAPDDFTGLDASCVSCHADDEPPNHFPGQCEECHNVFDWDNADFDHPDFPIPHQGVSSCGDCHPNSSNYQTFTCTDCHAHEKNQMDDEHQGEVGGYVYDSDACLDCHPQGRE